MPLRSTRPTTFRRRAVARRKTDWATSAIGPTTVSAGATWSAVDLLASLEVAGASILGATVMRAHIALSCSSTTSDTGPGITWGLIVWDTTLSKPDPSSDFLVPWMMLRFLPPQMGHTTFINGTSVLYAKEYEVRSRRRLKNFNERPFVLLKNDGSAAMSVSMLARTLIALP